MRMILIMIAAAALLWGTARLIRGPGMDVDTFVETPQTWESMFNKGFTASMRVSPRVDLNAAETVIKWPAFKASHVAAVPLELHIRKAQWADRHQVTDHGFVAPETVGLRVDWPESAEERAKAPEDEDPTILFYGRVSGIGRDFLYDEGFRDPERIHYATPLDAPREEAVLVWCIFRKCTMYFEHLGRPAQLHFPKRRVDDWEEGYRRSRGLLASIASPIGSR